jgi:hypothetical protein
MAEKEQLFSLIRNKSTKKVRKIILNKTNDVLSYMVHNDIIAELFKNNMNELAMLLFECSDLDFSCFNDSCTEVHSEKCLYTCICKYGGEQDVQKILTRLASKKCLSSWKQCQNSIVEMLCERKQTSTLNNVFRSPLFSNKIFSGQIAKFSKKYDGYFLKVYVRIHHEFLSSYIQKCGNQYINLVSEKNLIYMMEFKQLKIQTIFLHLKKNIPTTRLNRIKTSFYVDEHNIDEIMKLGTSDKQLITKIFYDTLNVQVCSLDLKMLHKFAEEYIQTDEDVDRLFNFIDKRFTSKAFVTHIYVCMVMFLFPCGERYLMRVNSSKSVSKSKIIAYVLCSLEYEPSPIFNGATSHINTVEEVKKCKSIVNYRYQQYRDKFEQVVNTIKTYENMEEVIFYDILELMVNCKTCPTESYLNTKSNKYILTKMFDFIQLLKLDVTFRDHLYSRAINEANTNEPERLIIIDKVARKYPSIYGCYITSSVMKINFIKATEQKKYLVSIDSLRSNEICCVCMIEQEQIVFSCGHALCFTCFETIRKTSNSCHMCRTFPIGVKSVSNNFYKIMSEIQTTTASK